MFLADDATEAWGLSNEGAEVGPEVEDRVASALGLGGSCRGSDLQSSAEVSREVVLGGRCSSTQGFGCG